MKLSEWAVKNSVCYKTAYRMFRKGLIDGARKLPTGTIVIDETVENIKNEYNIIYARVSSLENRNNLDSQAKRISEFCNAKGWIVNEIVKECASGLNDKRPKLQKILSEGKARRIIVEHKDRLTRFGFEYIKTLFDGEIIILNEVEEDKKDLMEDFVSLVTSFCARLYGKRRTKRKTEQLIKELEQRD